MKHTLKYIRVAKAAKDGYDGFLYMHHWSTGWQELIFATHDLAKSFLDKLNKTTQPHEQSTPQP